MRRSLGLCLGALAITFLVLWSCSKDEPLSPNETPARHEPLTESVGLWIAPVQGLTSGWYPAPAKFTVTSNVRTVTLKLVTAEKARVIWNGATEVSRTATESYAECTLPPPGSRQLVQAEARAQDGTEKVIGSFSAGILVSSRGVDDVHISSVALSDAEPHLDQYTTPATRMRLLLDGRVIAAIKSIGPDAYRTAAGAPVHVKAISDELGLLVEWRLDGKPLLLGTEGDLLLPNLPGKHQLSVGPVSRVPVVRVETFGTSVVADRATIEAGVPVTFHVTTNPPGFESEVVWMSGTLNGTADPPGGKGGSFTAVFDRPWPTTPDGIVCMGVRAGAAAVIVESENDFGYDMARLDSDLNDAQQALGKHVCCITDSLARQQTFDAINTLVKSRDAINHALSAYNSLSKLTKKAVNLAYGDFEGNLRTQLSNIETALAKFKTLPDCSNANLLSKGEQALTFCQDLVDFLYGFGQALTALGLILVSIGLVLVWLPTVGPPIVLAGILFGTAGGLLVLISYAIPC